MTGSGRAADQLAGMGVALIAASASVTELGEQSLTDTVTCVPAGSWEIAATARAVSVRPGPG